MAECVCAPATQVFFWKRMARLACDHSHTHVITFVITFVIVYGGARRTTIQLAAKRLQRIAMGLISTRLVLDASARHQTAIALTGGHPAVCVYVVRRWTQPGWTGSRCSRTTRSGARRGQLSPSLLCCCAPNGAGCSRFFLVALGRPHLSPS